MRGVRDYTTSSRLMLQERMRTGGAPEVDQTVNPALCPEADTQHGIFFCLSAATRPD